MYIARRGGSEIQKKLNYCNKCGVKIGGGDLEKLFLSDSKENGSPSQNISTAIAFVGLGGMLAIVIFALKLLDRNVDIGAVEQ